MPIDLLEILLDAPANEDGLPAALLERFAGSPGERMVALLRFLGPITGGQVQAR